MKWKLTRVVKITSGIFGNHTEMCWAINKNADLLMECCNHVKELEKKIEELEKGEQNECIRNKK